MPPAWYLDVDGVIGPLRGEGKHDADLSWAPAFLYDHPRKSLASVPYLPEITARIQDMHDTGLVEVQWLTTWPEQWCAHWERAGLGPFEYNAPRYDCRLRWKAAVVKEWLDSHPTGRAVWTDDDMRPGRRLRGYGLRLLAIQPDSETELTHPHLDRIKAWLARPSRH